jgi:tetratricopeptide (TPR) repeat protein
MLRTSLLIFSLMFTASAQQSKLGKVGFPTSGSPEAQAYFLRGVAALHSFWFEEALDAFRESTRIEPDFMMGYWGEAMVYNHPLWAQQDTEAGRKTVAKIADTTKLTARERAYLAAVKALYGEGDKLTRDKAYSEAMEKVYRAYPDDLEAACFYSLSLLGTVRPGDKGFRRQMQAGAIALDVYAKNPDHPGAAHYIIHSFDDPEHAILALPAARRYAEIAPEAHHARHMPSHIFLQLGMWPEAAASNESSWAASDAWVKRKGLPITSRDYHSFHWLLYVYTQQGRYGKAEELLSKMQNAVQESGNDLMMRRNYFNMAAVYLVETRRWDRLPELFNALGTPAEGQASGHDAGEHGAHDGAQMPADPKAAGTYQARGSFSNTYVTGLADAESGKESVQKEIAELKAMSKQMADGGDAYRGKIVEIMALEVEAAALAKSTKYDDAIGLLKRATALEEDLSPPSGPPEIIKPSHELFGEILLAAGKPKEAAQQFATALLRQPNRARSLLGAARAAAKSGDTVAAAQAYSNFQRQWSQADPQCPELREARGYPEQARAR